jgi:transposase
VHGDYQVFLGLDVGKDGHHAVGLAPDGKRLHDAALVNTEDRLRQVFDKLARHGRILVVVDQPASIGALPVAVARAAGHQVAYLPGLAMRRIADLHPGNAKTDARDAYVIADAARTLPHTLRRVDAGDETLAELEVLVGYDDDLAGEATRVSNRIRGLLTQIHPALERVLGPKVQHKAVLELLSRCGGPAGLRKAGRRKLVSIAVKNAPRMGERLIEQVMTALEEQTVTVPGTAAAEKILPRLADSLRDVLQQRDQVAAECSPRRTPAIRCSCSRPASTSPQAAQNRHPRGHALPIDSRGSRQPRPAPGRRYTAVTLMAAVERAGALAGGQDSSPSHRRTRPAPYQRPLDHDPNPAALPHLPHRDRMTASRPVIIAEEGGPRSGS